MSVNKRRLPRTALAAAAMMTAAALAAGCGSNDGAGAAASTGPVKVLTFGEITGLGPQPMPQAQDGIVAAVDAVNAAGGIDGRKVDLVECNTKLVPSAEEGCVAKAAAQGIVAAIPSEEVLDNITTPILEKQGIPILGANPTTATAQYSKSTACFISGAFVLTPQSATTLAGAGATSLSFMSATTLSNADAMQQATSAAASEGGAAVKKFVGVAPTATDFSSIAAQSTSAGEDGTFISALPPGLFSIIGDVTQSNPGIKIAAPGYLILDPQVMTALAKFPPAKGMYVNNYTAFPTDATVPGIKLFQQQIATVNKADLGDEQALFGWLDGWGAMQVIESVKSGPVNAQTISAAMKTATVSFDGVAPAWHYQYNTLGLGCVTDNMVYEGRYQGGTAVTPLNGGKPVPGLSPQLIALYKKVFASYAK